MHWPAQIFLILTTALLLLATAGPWYVATDGAVDLDGMKRIHSGTTYGFR